MENQTTTPAGVACNKQSTSARTEVAPATDLFGFESKANIKVFPDTGDHRVPKIDDNYVFTKELVEDILYVANKPRANIASWFYGHRGTGKTSVITQVLARMNYPTLMIAGTEETEVYQLVGYNRPINGSFEYVYAPLSHAMKYGCALVINEFDMLNPTVSAVLHDVLEGMPLVLPENGNEVIYPHADFCLFVTGNTNGAGDELGLYAGTQPQNPALMDRFAVNHVDYLDKATEEAIVANVVPKLDETTRSMIIDYARITRELFVGEFTGSDDYPELADLDRQVRTTQLMSTRTVLNWAERLVMFRKRDKPIFDTLERVFLNKCQPAERMAFEYMAKLMFGFEDKGDKS